MRNGRQHEYLPLLETGDRLPRAEFERRYDAMPHVKKAELLDGLVFMGSPVHYSHHSLPHRQMIVWLATYELATPGVQGGDNATTRLTKKSELQPDSLLLIRPECGGQTRISDDDYVENAPELVADISASTVSIDMHTKRDIYQQAGVKEYIVWRVVDDAIDWFVLKNGQYETMQAESDGVHRSRVFPGLWLDAKAMIQGDLSRVLAVVQEGVKSPAHGEFVERLAKTARSSGT